MPPAGEDQRKSVIVGGGNDFVVAAAAAGFGSMKSISSTNDIRRSCAGISILECGKVNVIFGLTGFLPSGLIMCTLNPLVRPV